MNDAIVEVLKIVVFASVVFVWAVRYQNIVEEFKHYGYPVWMRDLVGITKFVLVIMIMSHDPRLIEAGAIGISLLMVAALITHLKVGNPFRLMLPSLTLLSCCVVILLFP